MKKLVLNLEELAVESFETQAPSEKLGTVFAQGESEVSCSNCQYSLCSCVISECLACWETPSQNGSCGGAGSSCCSPPC